MRKFLLSLFLTAFCCVMNAGDISVGYSNGEVAKSSDFTVRGKNMVSAAVYVTPELYQKFVGNEVKAINVGLASVKSCDSVSVWIRETLDGEDLAYGVIKRGGTPSPHVGWNAVTLNSPFALEEGKSFYIGYTYAQRGNDATVSVVDGSAPNSSYIKRGSSANWENISDRGVISLEMLVNGDNMPQYDLVLNRATGSQPSPGILSVSASITNLGQVDIADYDISFSAEGYNYVYKSLTPVASGETVNVDVLLYDVPEGVGYIYPMDVTITRLAGGEDTFADDNTVRLSWLVPRNVAVEEFTGTGCGWCPRGLVGMEKMNEKYGDRFVGLALHQYNSDDPMYFTAYKNLGVSGFPSSFIDRKFEADPYYGTDEVDVCHDIDKALLEEVLVSVGVKAEYNEDKTEVNITGTVTAFGDVSGLKATFVLTADDLTGTQNSWKQSNYYTSYSSSQLPPDLAQFGAGGENGTSTFAWAYDDVVIAAYKSGTSYEMNLNSMGQMDTQTITTTLKMPTKAILKDAIIYEKVKANILLLNGAGQVVNCNKAFVTYSDNVREKGKVSSENVREVARYTVDGQRIAIPQKGINIIRLSDGSTKKVNVR